MNAEVRAPDRDAALLCALRSGDESAFQALVRRYHGAMLRVAASHVRSSAVAEEVVQDAWLAVVEGLSRFEGRSSFRTWLFTIVANRAKTRGVREARTVPFSALARDDGEGDTTVDADRFGEDGHWTEPPAEWRDPEQRLRSLEGFALAKKAIEALPAAQRAVITLRDVEGLSSEEVCTALDLSDGNQRVLLHRARAKVRAALESQLVRPD
jgi:RNA polymerase sigma-70 factor (ECF subfamily)